MTATRRISLLGGQTDAMTTSDLLDWMAEAVRSGDGGLMLSHNLHSLHLLPRSAEMRALYAQADRIQIDSMPLIAWGRLLGRPVERAHRQTYLDWREAFWSLAAREGWRIYHLGCAPGVGEAALDTIRARHPDLIAAGRDGFFAPDQAGQVLAEIRAFKPHVLLVGMGMPRQEAWTLANLPLLPGVVVAPIGGALAYEAGAVKTPPRWTGRFGLEWLWRFSTEPRRLFHRYFVEPWSLVGPALADLRTARL